MTRREYLALSTAGALAASDAAAKEADPIINAAEHAWVLHDERFPINSRLSNCPNNRPDREYSMEHILSRMQLYKIDKVVISHVCYYGTDNSYPAYMLKQHPDRFAAIGLLVGYRLHSPGDSENPARLERLVKEQGFSGLRLSPIYDRDVVWMNDPAVYPLWKKAEELGAMFNIFLAPHQISQVADMAERFPGVKIVIDHFAMIDITRPDDEGIDQILDLEKFPNVYIRTSLHNPSKEEIPYRDMWPYLRRVYDRFGPQRMLYANFYELVVMKDIVPFFTSEDKKWILGKTAAGIYHFAS